jgi:hypothetical protein
MPERGILTQFQGIWLELQKVVDRSVKYDILFNSSLKRIESQAWAKHQMYRGSAGGVGSSF